MTNNPAQNRARLLVLTSTFPRWKGDAEPGFVFDLCRRLVGEFDVTVLAPHAAGARRREILAGMQVIRFRYGPGRCEKLAYEGGIMANLRRNPLLYFMLPPFFLALLFALLGQMRRLRPDALHAHWIIPQGAAMAAAGYFASRMPTTLCTAHGSDVSALQGVFWQRLRRWVASRCDGVAAVSEAIRDRLVSEGSCVPGRVAVIPMGADLQDLFVPDGSPRNAAEILFVGRLVEGKGADILLRALPAVLASQPDATLTVVGGGPERERLAGLAQQLGIESRVSLVGPVAHAALAAFYRRAALLALPSREEGFGLVLVEALGCGCPVVASDLPAIRSLLHEGQAGRLCRAGDADALAQALVELLADGDARRALAEHGRQHVLPRHDWSIAVRRYAMMLAPNAPAGEGDAGHA